MRVFTLKDFESDVASALKKAVPKVKKDEILELLEKPPSPELGDLAFPCFKLAGLFKKSPEEVAKELESKIKKPKSVKRVLAVGAFLNFFFEKSILAEKILKQVLKEKNNFGKSKEGKGKQVMVEFLGPNTNKPLHVGHLRNAFLGNSISNFFQLQGWKVIKANLVNDKGVHICKSMLAFEKYGRQETPQSTGVKGDKFVGNYYVLFGQKAAAFPQLEEQALEMLKQWEKGNNEVRKLWKAMRDWCLQGFEQTLKSIGVKFDKLYFESDLYDEGKEIVLNGLKKGLFKKQEGAVIAELESHNLPNAVLLRSDGTTLYITQDLHLARKKFSDFKLAKSVYVVGNEQNLHFKQLFKILEVLGFKNARNCFHLSYGMVLLESGKMKSREGKVVDADDLFEEVKELARKEILARYGSLPAKELDKRSHLIALSALKFFLLKIDAVKDLVFNPEESVSFEGETGPYLLYSYARAKSILRKAGVKVSGKINYSMLVKQKEKELVLLLAQYPEVLKESLQAFSPHKLCQYLLDLSATFNSFYHESPVLKVEPKLMLARLALVQASSIVLKNALNSLGIEVLEEM